ncbi:hypothetical protein PW52_11785 [Tamlana sedimentorum]|uniref:Uncharacterized protein n=1 Tax=Neotamlana sedimentorum TaxID=1435349 RepID=A0A0D7W7C6_9FLAO|nr:hypothetical protein PW52_11785 [Tamlana sedimentorum]
MLNDFGMKDISPTYAVIESFSDLLIMLVKSPFFFLIIVIFYYSLLNKKKRESVNAEMVKLINALRGKS